MTLYNELRKHGKLAAKRHPMYEKNRFGKAIMIIMSIFWGGYLIFFGTIFGLSFGKGSQEGYDVLNSGLIFILALDFLIRFPFQKTPTQEVKPYLLMPVKRNRIIDCLLIRSGLSSFNLFWLFLFVPFSFLTVFRLFGLLGVISYCVGIWLLMVVNNYWFMMCRTLLQKSIWWTAIPVVVYGGLAAAIIIPKKSPISYFFMSLGEGFIQSNLLVFLAVLAVIYVFWFINHKLSESLIYDELNRVEDTNVNASEYKFFDRYGEMGEYMRLELKMQLRNKACKYSLRMILLVVLAFSMLMSFTDSYQGFMKTFIVEYNFAIFGMLFLMQIMAYEGNYMDGLMSRKESIYTLLRAKYTLYSIAILIPLLLMIPAVVTGKVTILEVFSWAAFTVGAIYCLLFQLAVYNNKTTPLNVRQTARQNMGTGLQNVISFGVFGIPLAFYAILNIFFSETTTLWILMGIGIALILTSRYWLKNVYNRFMARRYRNMADFRDSREG